MRVMCESVRSSIVPATSASVASCADRLEDHAGDALAGRGGDLLPVLVAEEGALGGPVEVLDGTAARLGFDQFDAVELEQGFDVVADVAERLAEFLGELVGAGDAVVQRGEDAHPQRVGERLRELLGDALGGGSGLRHGGILRSIVFERGSVDERPGLNPGFVQSSIPERSVVSSASKPNSYA